MSRLRVLIVGSGKRVRETALPAFLQAQDALEVVAVCARTQKTLDVAGQAIAVRPFESFTAAELAAIDLVYLAVGKSATPLVLRRLVDLGAGPQELLIDTPVLVFKYFRHTPLLSHFARVGVAEDCAYLPWIDVVHGAVEAGILGRLRRARFDQAAYAYHAHSTLKALVPGAQLLRASRRGPAGGPGERSFVFTNSWNARVVDPRDYSRGHFVLQGERASASDAPERESGSLHLGFDAARRLRLGDVAHELDEAELSLLGPQALTRSLTAAMEAHKRVGFLRLLRAIATGRGAYPLQEGLDDMVADYWLEKAGRYWATPLTSIRSPLARTLYRGVTKLVGRN